MTSPILERPASSSPIGQRVLVAPLFVMALLALAVNDGRSLDAVSSPGVDGLPTSVREEVGVGRLVRQKPVADRPAPAPADRPFLAPVPTLPAPPSVQPVVPVTPAPPTLKKWLPSGKGMWIYVPDQTEGGNIDAIVAKAKATGLTHLWVRMGSAWDGFNVAPFVSRLLPAAHAAGIKIIGWDFPKLEPWEADVQRALVMIAHMTPDGHRIDAFSADIETRAEGTRISPEAARAYGAALRAGVGADYPLIATVPRPSKERAGFPYAEVVADYDAIAPMVYWLNRQPDTDVAGALRDLAGFGKPVYPVGQAYDGFPEGGRRGVPPRDELLKFMGTAQEHGAAGVSFWSWQAANQQAWDAIREATQFQGAADAALGVPQDFSP